MPLNLKVDALQLLSSQLVENVTDHEFIGNKDNFALKHAGKAPAGKYLLCMPVEESQSRKIV